MTTVWDVPDVGRVVRGQGPDVWGQGDRVVRSGGVGEYRHEDGRPLSARELRRVMVFMQDQA